VSPEFPRCLPMSLCGGKVANVAKIAGFLHIPPPDFGPGGIEGCQGGGAGWHPSIDIPLP
jgi:hypothetical protein